MIIGYLRLSTRYRSAQLQRSALEEADCEQVFVKRVTHIKRERPERQAYLRSQRDGVTLAAWKLGRFESPRVF
ncbi:recombinase family protein [Marinobacter sp. TBZ242]|uniref:Recombinase family protein n=1 Tax=Marinobacter azerbaijanicus TaxID=3050455 RepID=A0ABT7IHV0_9GAMM|nr:recombinase family protein [Marinobacter sp. TBZ242]MDL0433760.1 recombinase family protein [Marinobacter sp. TBZ242]